jgi:hypothetical protein
MYASWPSDVNVHESILVIHESLDDNGVKPLSIEVVSVVFCWRNSRYVSAINSSCTLWELPSTYKTINKHQLLNTFLGEQLTLEIFNNCHFEGSLSFIGEIPPVC